MAPITSWAFLPALNTRAAWSHNIFHHRQPFQEARQYISAEADVEREQGIVGVIAGGLVDRPEMTQLCVRLAWIRYLRRQAYDAWR